MRRKGNNSTSLALIVSPAPEGSQAGTPMRLIIFIIVIILLLGALPTWPYSGGWGYYPSGGLGTVLIILLILAVLGII